MSDKSPTDLFGLTDEMWRERARLNSEAVIAGAAAWLAIPAIGCEDTVRKRYRSDGTFEYVTRPGVGRNRSMARARPATPVAGEGYSEHTGERYGTVSFVDDDAAARLP